ncbi:hypothetical protein RchiOBHm_Chr2g0117141 [Rosa chinensis]|uniref:Uncharacterized protein n=1 Tax=Rosa chinensis TaxID=74649 RepID=A0A2P6RRF6_ROSCH|nr:hypothetical protein RchiOBHm_Chr2g0117141 [Rosa chinensis]
MSLSILGQVSGHVTGYVTGQIIVNLKSSIKSLIMSLAKLRLQKQIHQLVFLLQTDQMSMIQGQSHVF